jgi:hypothetical protein
MRRDLKWWQHPIAAAVGETGTNILFPEPSPSLATRPSLGAEGKAAMAEQARAIQSIMNQQLMQTTIPMINREFAGAGRYASGQRLGAIERATGQAQGMAGGLARQGAMDLYLAQLKAMEDRQWRQAQLNLAAGDDSIWGELGEAAPYLLMFLKMFGGG